jgi:hypothetical protein
MRIFLINSLLLFVSQVLAQNNLRISSADGSTFKVKRHNEYVTKNLEADLLIDNILEDSLKITLEFADMMQSDATIYLIEKGKKTSGREFDYKVERVQNKIKIYFMGIYDVTELPNPIVPKKPVTENSSK